MNTAQRTISDWILEHRKQILPLAAVALLLVGAVVLYFGKAAHRAGEVFPLTEEAVAGQGIALTDASDAVSGGADLEGTSGGAVEFAAGSEMSEIVVDVSGAVNAPAVLTLRDGCRVYEAIASAGGVTAEADLRNINQAALLRDGDRLYIPTRKEAEQPSQIPLSAGSVTGAGDAGSGNAAAGAPININTADEKTLQLLNGVGPSTAAKIIEYRAQHGAFRNINDIKKVSGIGEKTFEKLKDKITV